MLNVLSPIILSFLLLQPKTSKKYFFDFLFYSHSIHFSFVCFVIFCFIYLEQIIRSLLLVYLTSRSSSSYSINWYVMILIMSTTIYLFIINIIFYFLFFYY